MFFLYLIAAIFCSISVFAAEFTTVSLANNSQINSDHELNTLISRTKPSDDQIKQDKETLKKNPSVALDKLDANNRTIFHISDNTTIIQAAIIALESVGSSPDLYDNNKNNPLHTAILQQKPFDIIKMLIKGKTNVNAENNQSKTPLHLAIFDIDFFELYPLKNEVIIALLEAQANPNIRDCKNNTPLHIVIKNNNKSLLESLIKANADPNAQNNKNKTPLHLAVKHKVFVEQLINANANPNIQDFEGNTPLHTAAKHNLFVEQLVNAEASLTIKNKRNETPSDLITIREKNAVLAKRLFMIN